MSKLRSSSGVPPVPAVSQLSGRWFPHDEMVRDEWSGLWVHQSEVDDPNYWEYLQEDNYPYSDPTPVENPLPPIPNQLGRSIVLNPATLHLNGETQIPLEFDNRHETPQENIFLETTTSTAFPPRITDPDSLPHAHIQDSHVSFPYDNRLPPQFYIKIYIHVRHSLTSFEISRPGGVRFNQQFNSDGILGLPTSVEIEYQDSVEDYNLYVSKLMTNEIYRANEDNTFYVGV